MQITTRNICGIRDNKMKNAAFILSTVAVSVLLTLAHKTQAEDGHWSSSIGLTNLYHNGYRYDYLSAYISKQVWRDIYLGGETTFAIDENRQQEVDGSTYIEAYIGISAELKKNITDIYGYRISVLAGTGMSEQTYIDSDTSSRCECQIFFIKPSIGLYTALSENIDGSINLSGITIDGYSYISSSLYFTYSW